ncbi:hypothetical protein RCL1_002942 [Eukaryota sp. TZLM3-RCL]
MSENDLVVTKASSGYGNSFVAIQHPVKGKVTLTLLNFATYFSAFIGLFHPSYFQNDDCHGYAHSLCVYNDGTQVYINYPNRSGPSQAPISVGQQVDIEFNNNKIMFSVPSLGFSYTVTWPSGCVFGLVEYHKTTSWKLSSS